MKELLFSNFTQDFREVEPVSSFFFSLSERNHRSSYFQIYIYVHTNLDKKREREE